LQQRLEAADPAAHFVLGDAWPWFHVGILHMSFKFRFKVQVGAATLDLKH
jgi:hypothetical protein